MRTGHGTMRTGHVALWTYQGPARLATEPSGLATDLSGPGADFSGLGADLSGLMADLSALGAVWIWVGCLDWDRSSGLNWFRMPGLTSGVWTGGQMPETQSDAWTDIGYLWHSRMPVIKLDFCYIVGIAYAIELFSGFA